MCTQLLLNKNSLNRLVLALCSFLKFFQRRVDGNEPLSPAQGK